MTQAKRRLPYYVATGALVMAAIIGGVIYNYVQQRETRRASASPAERGWMAIEDHGCTSCHQGSSSFRAPTLQKLVGREITLTSGIKIIADEAYIRESILSPKAKISMGYAATMPTYEGVVTDSELADIIAALR